MKGNNLVVLGLIILGAIALAGGLIGVLLAKDADTQKNCLVIAAIGGSAVGGLSGHLNIGHDNVPTKPAEIDPTTLQVK